MTVPPPMAHQRQHSRRLWAFSLAWSVLLLASFFAPVLSQSSTCTHLGTSGPKGTGGRDTSGRKIVSFLMRPLVSLF